jgi:hypothetical protein
MVNACKILDGKSEDKRGPLSDRGADETEIRRGDVDWIHWVQHEVQYWAFVSMVRNQFHKRQRV